MKKLQFIKSYGPYILIGLVLVSTYQNFMLNREIAEKTREIEYSQAKIVSQEKNFNKEYDSLKKTLNDAIKLEQAKNTELQKNNVKIKRMVSMYERKIADIKPVTSPVTAEKYNTDIQALKLTIAAYRTRVTNLELLLANERKQKELWKKKLD